MHGTSWLLLLYALPTARNRERVNLWRKLRKFGAVQLDTSGYVLPDVPHHRERFQWLSKQIVDAGGDTTLIRVAEIDGVSNQEVMQMFNDARAADYKDLTTACRKAFAKYKKTRALELKAELQKFKQRFGEIKGIDYFNSPAAHAAEMVLRQMEKILAPLNGGKETQQRLEPSRFAGRVWMTRPRPGIDRAGSAWLIRKFIDPKAKFVFGLEAGEHPGAVPFDMADVEFSHHGEDCTFETLVKRFGINDKAVLKMAEMVHDADLEDGKFQRCECIGIDVVLTGWARTSISDSELLEKGVECFEGLYNAVKK